MRTRLSFLHHDLITPDGIITSLRKIDERHYEAWVTIENISPSFLGFSIEKEWVFFNIKSSLAQLGVNGKGKEYELSYPNRLAKVRVELEALN